jgi:hypothetical protein
VHRVNLRAALASSRPNDEHRGGDPLHHLALGIRANLGGASHARLVFLRLRA